MTKLLSCGLATQNGYIFAINILEAFKLEILIYISTVFRNSQVCFFALNHQNYARWLVRYHDNLLKLSETYQEVYKDFQEGCFAIKRTQKDFSAFSIDLTLEQTINANVTGQKTCITSLSNSIGARQRWARSHFLCTKIISYVFDKVGMSKKEDVAQDLRPNQMQKNNKHSQNIETLPENVNPFSENIEFI